MAIAAPYIDRTAITLLNELKDECARYIKLAGQIENKNLTEDQLASILGELTASLAHLNIHSEICRLKSINLFLLRKILNL